MKELIPKKMEEYIYEGIVLTSIDVVDSPTSTAPSRVTFSTATRGTRNDTTATFIHKVRDVKDPSGEEAELLEAEKLSVEQVRSLINGESEDNAERSTDEKDAGANRKVLFSVHGAQGNSRGYLLQIKQVEERFKKFKLVPILWPSAGQEFLAYFTDRGWSKAAGAAFQSMIPATETFSKSVLCHSMGNRVLKYFANEANSLFDNIFMVASDVNSDLFNKKYIDGGNQEWRKDGVRITDMLTKGKGGKIHVVHNKNDQSLLLSAVINTSARLGRQGLPLDGDGCFSTNHDEVHPEVKDHIVNVDWTNNSPSEMHSYQFDWSLVAYYESQYV